MSKKPIEMITIEDTDSESEEGVEIVKLSSSKKQQQSSFQNNKDKKSISTTSSSSNAVASSSKRFVRSVEDSDHQDEQVKKPKIEVPSMNRLEMEKERLARVARLEAANGGEAITPSLKIIPTKTHAHMPELNTISDTPQEEESAGGSYSNGWNTKKASTSSSSSGASGTTSSGKSQYFKGKIKRVYNRYTPNDGGMRLGELIGDKKGKLGVDHPNLAIISSFALDMEWVVGQFKEETSLLIITRRDKDDHSDKVSQIGLKSKMNQLFLLYPDMPLQGAMHVKIAIFCYNDYMRVIIPTANFVQYDWDIMDNAFYIQDFPLLSNIDRTLPHPKDNPSHTPSFSLALFEFLQQLGVPKLFLNPFKQYDFKASDEVRLVVSRSGNWNKREDKFEDGGGMVGLSKAVKSFGFQKGGKWELEASGSSLGGLDNIWLSQFLAAASGTNPSSYISKTSLIPPHLVSSVPQDTTAKWNAPIKIIFPTLADVDGSFNARPGGGTLFCTKATWLKPGFPQHLFHTGENKNRPKVLAHTKMIAAIKTIREGIDDESTFKYEGWIYIGSHNFTGAAWGKLRTPSPSSAPQLSINNFELGVLLPIKGATSSRDLESKVGKLMTFERPVKKYEVKGGVVELPWCQFSYK